ncbi:MAG: arginine--tRNA ligase [Syntrophomonadaceae bacterium]|nr:arginine--tRNA ligase [Syntrophomonadaceae bacterium]
MNLVKQIQDELKSRVEKACEQAREQGRLPYTELPSFVVEVPREKAHGDFAVNVAMLLARQARMAPARIAELIAGYLPCGDQLVKRVEIAGGGFINFFLEDDWLYLVPQAVWDAGDKWGTAPARGKRVQVEFVSANPTGDLHMGNARGGAIGDSLANILAAAGYEVQREYYVNDAGNQMELFAASLEARYLQEWGLAAEVPEGGYAGQDVLETVRRFIAAHGDRLLAESPATRRQRLASYALAEKLEYIRATLEEFGIRYDRWFSEQSLYDSGKVDEVVALLKQRGALYQRDGAWWFRAEGLGQEKDEVVIRSNGIPTYFAADIAYHVDKFERGFDLVIDVWGADHHGHVARMKAAMAVLGIDPERLQVILMQLVRLYRGGEIVRMSKRTGTLVTLNELIEEVGKDAARFSFVMRSPDSHLDFDLELAKQQSMENPVFYAQYAHARVCSIMAQARMAGVRLQPPDEVDVRQLSEPAEKELLRKIADYPNEVVQAAESMSPHRISRYVLDIAGMFHSYYNHYRVLQAEPAVRAARLLLVETFRRTLKHALGLLGVSAPEKM